MPATIKCDNQIKSEIKSYLLEEFHSLMEKIRKDEDSVSVEDVADGLNVEFPIGEIYGSASDYVQDIPYIFDNLKKTYSEIEINGIAYEYETRQEATFGPFFYCTSDDSELTVTYEWQECVSCGKIMEADVLYNSSQRDYGEGNLLCLCSPTCMLEYIIKDEENKLQPNDSFTDDEMDMIYDSIEADEDSDDTIKKILWNRVIDNTCDYLEEFVSNKDRIFALVNEDQATDEQKAFLQSVLNQI